MNKNYYVECKIVYCIHSKHKLEYILAKIYEQIYRDPNLNKPANEHRKELNLEHAPIIFYSMHNLLNGQSGINLNFNLPHFIKEREIAERYDHVEELDY